MLITDDSIGDGYYQRPVGAQSGSPTVATAPIGGYTQHYIEGYGYDIVPDGPISGPLDALGSIAGSKWFPFAIAAVAVYLLAKR